MPALVVAPSTSTHEPIRHFNADEVVELRRSNYPVTNNAFLSDLLNDAKHQLALAKTRAKPPKLKKEATRRSGRDKCFDLPVS